jgi:hypothetical protein
MKSALFLRRLVAKWSWRFAAGNSVGGIEGVGGRGELFQEPGFGLLAVVGADGDKVEGVAGDLAAEVGGDGIDDIVGMCGGRRVGAGVAGSAVGEDGAGGAEAGFGVVGGKVLFEDLEGGAEEGLELLARGVGEFPSAAIEFGDEEGVEIGPAPEGGAVDGELAGDGGGGMADEEELDGL